MKKHIQELVWIAVLVPFLGQGCASVMQGSTQQISVTSKPSAATVVVNGFQRLKTPTVLELSRKESHQLEISLEGYHTEQIDITQVSSSMPAGNLLVGGLVGLAVDYSTGAAFRLVPEVVHVDLRPITLEPSQIPVTPGVTGAENTKTPDQASP